MNRTSSLFTFAMALLLSVSSALAQHRTLTIVNSGEQPVWAVLTPGGSPSEGAELYNSGGWFQQTATMFNWVPTTFTGTIAAGSLATVTLGSVNNAWNFAAGQLIQIPGAGADGGNLQTTIASVTLAVVSGTTITTPGTLTLNPPATTPVTSAAINEPAEMAAFIAASGNPPANTLALPIPDSGAASVNLYFATGCPGDTASTPGTTGPLDPAAQCIIAPFGATVAAIETRFEGTFGCVAGTSQCAFNPSSNATNFPNCASAPDATNCQALPAVDAYDVTAVDGYTMAMKLTVTPPGSPKLPFTCGTGTGQVTTLDASNLDLASCPGENAGNLYSSIDAVEQVLDAGISLLARDTSPKQHYQACVAPYKWLEDGLSVTPNPGQVPNPTCSGGTCNSVTYYAGVGCDSPPTAKHCPGGSAGQEEVGPLLNGTQAIENTIYVRQVYQMGNKPIYRWQYDDQLANQSCPSSNNNSYPQYTLTVSPNGGNPYSASQRWTYSNSNNTCTPTSDSTAPYSSLIDCQHDRMNYVCKNVEDDTGFPNAMWVPSTKTDAVPFTSIPTFAFTCQTVSAPGSCAGGSCMVPLCRVVYSNGGTFSSPCPTSLR
jgi:hypothetical protein